MEKEYIYRFIPLAALFSTLGVIFPVFFHFLGLGSAFLPMFLPIIMGSVLLPASLALTIAIVTPLVSFLFTGMPPAYPPILLMVLLELSTVSLLSSYLFFKKHISIWITLAIALLADRLILCVFILFLARYLNFPAKYYSIGGVIYGIPGIVLILVVVPAALKFLRNKYPQLLPSQ